MQSEVDDVIRDLKKIPGFNAFLILNNDGEFHINEVVVFLFHCLGIVIKFDNMNMKTAVHHAHQILSLTNKASKYVRDLFDAPDVS